MTPTMFAVVLASAVAAPAPEERIKPPAGPPPVQVVANMTGDGNIEVVQTVTEFRVETRTVTKVVMGKNVAQNYMVTVPVTRQTRQQFSAKDAKVRTAGGKEVDAKDVPEKLKKPTIVLWSPNGQKVDPFYLKIIKEDTLVIVSPPTSGPAPDATPHKPKD